MDEAQLAQTFDTSRSELVFDFEGDVSGLSKRWAAVTRDQKLKLGIARTTTTLAGMAVFAITLVFLVVDALWQDGQFAELLRPRLPVDVGPEALRLLLPLVVGLSFVSWVIRERLETRTPKLEIDARKRSLVDALVAYLERELEPDQSLSLHIEFLPALREGYVVHRDARFDFSELAIPATEPIIHDWLLLSTTFGGVELHLRARSLVGKMGFERRIRDEIGVEVDGPDLGLELEPVDEDRLRTRLRDHESSPGRARFLFRGVGAGRRTQLELPPTALGLVGLPESEAPPEYEYEDLDWLLRGSGLVDHLEYVRRVT